MSTRRHFPNRLLIPSGVLLVAVGGLLLWRSLSDEEPVYQGRPLRSWLDHHVASSSARPRYGSPGWKEADEAIRHIGTNAIPTLVAMLRAKDPPAFVLKWMDWLRRHGVPGMPLRRAMSGHEEAEYAFGMLGANGVSAVPELVEIYRRNISESSQMNAALALGHIGRGAEAALPVLLANFTHTNEYVRFHAVSAVMNIGGQPAVVIPALTRALKHPFVSVRWNSPVGLSMYGRRATEAVAEIQKMVDDPGTLGEESIQPQVELAVWRIAPEKTGKALVVEDATPMISNGVTSQALKILSGGRRMTYIPTGHPVPAGAQYFSSDPRSGLMLYRGADDSDAADRFLGRFEVLDLPASDGVNVSTLCVVAEGKIWLCARDNDRHRFLEVRRVAQHSGE